MTAALAPFEADLEAALKLADPAARGAVLEALVKHLPGRHDQGTHGSGGGSGDDFDDDDGDGVVVNPSVIASTQAGGYTVRAVDDPDGVLDQAGNAGTYVEVASEADDPPGESDTTYTPAQARDIAGGVDRAATSAARTTPPPHPDDLDAPRPPAYENGPATIATAQSGEYTVIAYHDAYDDMGGGTQVAIGRAGDSAVDWDSAVLSVDLAEAPAFAAALRDMAGQAGPAKSLAPFESDLVTVLDIADDTARAAALALLAKHLPGKHDQSSHGKGGGLRSPAGIKKTYEMTDEKTGFRTKVVGSGPDPDWGPTYTRVDISVRDRDGEEVGEAIFRIHDGGKTVHHSEMLMDSGVQGQGFATRAMTHVVGQYQRYGVKTLTLTANSDVGGYAWARAGFQFREGGLSGGRSAVARHALSRATSSRYDAATRAEIRRVARNPSSSPIDFAMIGHTAGATMWPGKQIMLSSTWDAELEL